jgi:lysophospholipase L1-like esterase
MRTLIRPVVVVAFVLMLVAVVAAPASAAAPVTPGSRYLALGDSVTFGYQEPSVVPAPNYRRPSTFPGYPGQLGAEIRLRVANAACPGETSASLINVRAPSLGCENAYRRLYPLHVRYRGSQLAYALGYLRKHPGTRLVSLMIGANDLFRCQSLTASHCTSESDQRAVFALIQRNVRKIVRSIRRSARYRGQLVVLHYFSLDYSSAFITGIVRRLNSTLDKAVKGYKVRIGDGFAEFRRASIHSANNPCTAGLLTQLHGNPRTCGVHPSYSGQALLAQALQKAITQ